MVAFLLAKPVCFEAAKNCNSGYATSPNHLQVLLSKGEGTLFIEKGKLGGAIINKKIHWKTLGVGSIMAFHWLSC